MSRNTLKYQIVILAENAAGADKAAKKMSGMLMELMAARPGEDGYAVDHMSCDGTGVDRSANAGQLKPTVLIGGEAHGKILIIDDAHNLQKLRIPVSKDNNEYESMAGERCVADYLRREIGFGDRKKCFVYVHVDASISMVLGAILELSDTHRVIARHGELLKVIPDYLA